jgi:hypothetical protein
MLQRRSAALERPHRWVSENPASDPPHFLTAEAFCAAFTLPLTAMTLLMPACLDCKHLDRSSIRSQPLRCAAFPDGVPARIAAGLDRHDKPASGDHGIQFEPLPESATTAK